MSDRLLACQVQVLVDIYLVFGTCCFCMAWFWHSLPQGQLAGQHSMCESLQAQHLRTHGHMLWEWLCCTGSRSFGSLDCVRTRPVEAL